MVTILEKIEQQMKSIQKDYSLMFKPQKLVPELINYLEELDNGMRGTRHPLVYSVPHSPAQNRMVNLRLQYNKQLLKEAYKTKNYDRCIFIYERPYRLKGLIYLVTSVELTYEQYWSFLSDVWIDTENPHQNLSQWHALWFGEHAPINRYLAMKRPDHVAYDNTPQEVTVYRGTGFNEVDLGLSWTTDKDTAIWFSKRFKHRVGYLLSGMSNNRTKLLKCVIEGVLIIKDKQ